MREHLRLATTTNCFTMEKNDKTILCEDDAAKIVEELLDAKNSAHHLGLVLNLKPTDVEAIQKMYRDPTDQLLEVIIKALRQGKLTWRAIVDALRSNLVGLRALADRVERAHFPDLASSNESVSGTAESATPTTSDVKSKNQHTKSKSDENVDKVDLPPKKKKIRTDSETGGNVPSTSVAGLTGSSAPVIPNTESAVSTTDSATGAGNVPSTLVAGLPGSSAPDVIPKTGSAVSTTSDNDEVKSKSSPVKRTSAVDAVLAPMKKTIKKDSATGGNVPSTSVAVQSGSSAPVILNTGSAVTTTSDSKFKSVQWPLSLKWKEGSMPYIHKLIKASSAVVNGKVYCKSPGSGVILQYDPKDGKWRALTQLEGERFSFTLFNGRLTTVDLDRSNSFRIRAWDDSFTKCDQMNKCSRKGKANSLVVGFETYIISAAVKNCKVFVYIYESTNINDWPWFTQRPVDLYSNEFNSSVVVDDYWYLTQTYYTSGTVLLGGRTGESLIIYKVHLPTLISNATATASSDPNTEIIWDELQKPPVLSPTLLNFHGHLLAIGGRECPSSSWGTAGKERKEIYRFEKETNQWKQCGKLPIGLNAPCCAVLPSGELMVAGGLIGETEDYYSNKVWIGTIV